MTDFSKWKWSGSYLPKIGAGVGLEQGLQLTAGLGFMIYDKTLAKV